MDVVSHGLWGGAAFVKKSKKSFWLAFAFGVLPDISAFGWFFISLLFRNGFKVPDVTKFEPPARDFAPQYVHTIYNYSHSIFIFLAVFLIIWVIRKKPLWEMSAWILHILMDIPTHTHTFFPTPFLYPFSHFEFSGFKWSYPPFFIANWAVLIILYSYLMTRRKRKK